MDAKFEATESEDKKNSWRFKKEKNANKKLTSLYNLFKAVLSSDYLI